MMFLYNKVGIRVIKIRDIVLYNVDLTQAYLGIIKVTQTSIKTPSLNPLSYRFIPNRPTHPSAMYQAAANGILIFREDH